MEKEVPEFGIEPVVDAHSVNTFCSHSNFLMGDNISDPPNLKVDLISTPHNFSLTSVPVV